MVSTEAGIARPGHADLRYAEIRRTVPPRVEAIRRGTQVRDRRRDVFKRRVERERKAQQRTMQVEWRQRFAAADDAHSAQALSKGLERALNLENHRCATPRHLRH